MNEEIKEILEKLKENISIVSVEEEHLLLDYITNLQEENKRLKELNENYPIEEELAETYKREENYKSRIEKAVEYIKEHSNSFSVLDTISNGTLLNILNGRSDE